MKRPRHIFLLKTDFWDSTMDPQYHTHIAWDIAYNSLALAQKNMLKIYNEKYKKFDAYETHINTDVIRGKETPVGIVAVWQDPEDSTKILRRMSHYIVSLPIVYTSKEVEDWANKIVY